MEPGYPGGGGELAGTRLLFCTLRPPAALGTHALAAGAVSWSRPLTSQGMCACGVSPKVALVWPERSFRRPHTFVNACSILLFLGIWSLTGSLPRIFLQEPVPFFLSVPTFLSTYLPGGLPAEAHLTALSLHHFRLLSCLLLLPRVFLFILCI